MIQRLSAASLAAYVAPVLMLCISNVFLTTAWYWHLKFTSKPLFLVIAISWSLALIEYCFAVPANRIGINVYSPAELKTIQEVITLTVFAVFAFFYLGQPIKWMHVAGFACIAFGAFLVFQAGD